MTGESRDSNDRSKNNTSSNSTNPSNSDNPFIRWRHYADEQVSSVLQGFIGIPTIFDKQTNNSHWAVFDEDLRKRDAMQEQQRRLKEAHQAEGVKTTTPDEVEIPVKKSSQHSDNLGYLHGMFAGHGSSDIPLYSVLREGTIAQIVRTSFGQDFGADTNNLSLVPYLALSQYSPLRLSLMERVRHHQQSLFPPTSGPSPATDNFPYCEAFEDLLLTTQGKSLHNSGSYFKENKSDIRSYPQNTINWITRLQKLGLLFIPSSEEPQTKYETKPNNHSSSSSLEKSTKDAETEEEMYDRFLARASSTPDQFFTNLESTFSAVEKLMKITSKNLELDPSQKHNKSKDVSSTPADSEKEVFSRTTVDHFTDEDGVETTTKVLKRFANGKELETSQTITGPPSVVAPRDIKSKPVSAHSEQEIGSYSVVEHETQSDGTVSIDITVWKRFADGRETETSSSHSSSKGDVVSSGTRSLESMEKREQNDAGSVQSDKQDGKKAKAGWFWG